MLPTAHHKAWWPSLGFRARTGAAVVLLATAVLIVPHVTSRPRIVRQLGRIPGRRTQTARSSLHLGFSLALRGGGDAVDTHAVSLNAGPEDGAGVGGEEGDEDDGVPVGGGWYAEGSWTNHRCRIH